MAWTEKHIKENDYTLSIERSQNAAVKSFPAKSQLTRTFNFLSQQVTTVTRDWMYEERGYEAGGSSAVSSTTTIQNFNDVQSPAEIKLMHAKLIELEGNPPPLEEIFPDQPLKKGVLRTTPIKSSGTS